MAGIMAYHSLSWLESGLLLAYHGLSWLIMAYHGLSDFSPFWRIIMFPHDSSPGNAKKQTAHIVLPSAPPMANKIFGDVLTTSAGKDGEK